ncbi:hypothetical protein K439DRAFT_1344119 [Ramaria rubella]|nr:hypothetical protein K439DRAFT_1344119 [Ramaria rubella]
MILAGSKSRQPAWNAWTRERLIHEWAIALGHLIELSTTQTYNSHLQSYLTFVKLHELPVESTADTLSFYVIFMAHHIKPQSVGAYLSGICNTLEPHFPNLCGSDPPQRKCPLSMDDLHLLISHYNYGSFNDSLFLTMLLTGFHALMRAAEFTQADAINKCNFKKLTMQHTISFTPSHFSFLLLYHKADQFYNGNIILVKKCIPDDVIQAAGRWSSKTFRIYICKHPVLLQALIHGRTLYENCV